MKEFPLKVANSGPHGSIEDKDGNIFFTAINQHYIGKLNPKTGEITEYQVPMPGRSPHTPIFDQKGMMWFTMQSGHVGRLNPATGEIKIQATPSQGTYPYGIQINSKGEPWYVDFRGPRVAKVDPNTMQITEYTLPNADARPRRIALTPDDVVWYTDFAHSLVIFVVGRTDVRTLWHRVDRQHPVVQRIEREAEH